MKGKMRFVDPLEKHKELQYLAAVFKEPSADSVKIDEVGKAFNLQLYRNNKRKCMSDSRCRCFSQALNKSKLILTSLPPTDAGAR